LTVSFKKRHRRVMLHEPCWLKSGLKRHVCPRLTEFRRLGARMRRDGKPLK